MGDALGCGSERIPQEIGVTHSSGNPLGELGIEARDEVVEGVADTGCVLAYLHNVRPVFFVAGGRRLDVAEDGVPVFSSH